MQVYWRVGIFLEYKEYCAPKQAPTFALSRAYHHDERYPS